MVNWKVLQYLKIIVISFDLLNILISVFIQISFQRHSSSKATCSRNLIDLIFTNLKAWRRLKVLKSHTSNVSGTCYSMISGIFGIIGFPADYI